MRVTDTLYTCLSFNYKNIINNTDIEFNNIMHKCHPEADKELIIYKAFDLPDSFRSNHQDIFIILESLDDISKKGIHKYLNEHKLFIESVTQTDDKDFAGCIFARSSIKIDLTNQEILENINFCKYYIFRTRLLDREIEYLQNTLKKKNQDITNVKNDLEFCRSEYNEIIFAYNNIKNEIDNYKKENHDNLNQISKLSQEVSEYYDQLNSLKNELKEAEQKYEKFKKLYQKTSKELEDYKGARLKYKRLYNEANQKLEDYKGARLKYKRLYNEANQKYLKCKNSISYGIGFAITQAFTKPGKRTLFLPYYIAKAIFQSIAYKRQKNKEHKKTDIIKTNPEQVSKKIPISEKIFNNSKIMNFIHECKNKPVILLYGEISLNIVDGSSIWLSSMYNTCISSANVILLSKQNIKSDIITSNFISDHKSLILEPVDLEVDDNLSPENASKILNYLDEIVPNIQLLVTRGISITSHIARSNCFKYRLIPYLTNFYTPTINGPEFNQNAHKELQIISHSVRTWLWQTSAMQEWLESQSEIDLSNSKLFEPIVDSIPQNLPSGGLSNNITIGYAGKIQPEWGILDLLQSVNHLNHKGHKIKVIIISSKISSNSNFTSDPDFITKIKTMLQSNHVTYLENLNRQEALEKLSSVDIVWCYRPDYFEENTLELSTKLLEGLSINKPVICYPNNINKNLLGEDYPYYLKHVNELEGIVKNFNDSGISTSVRQKLDNYKFENRKYFFNDFINQSNNKLITFAGHDFKFINSFYSFLKSKGYQVFKDTWEWGKAQNMERSKYCCSNSEIIFCEWGLANAVWYSHNISSDMSLYVRIHAQEIREKAQKFGNEINYDNITNLIYVSDEIRTKSLSLFNINYEKTKLIPNYVLTDDFKIPEAIPSKKLNFGMVGIIPQLKRLDRAIDLMELVLERYPDAKLYIKGKLPEQLEWMHAPGRKQELEFYYKQYSRIKNNSKLRNAIIFDGYDQDMPEWYQKINIILSPSDHESFHYALADGIASGCYPIIWERPHAAQLFSKQYIVENTEKAFVKVIKYKKLSSHELYKIMVDNRDLICNQYDNKNIFEKLEILFQ